MTDDLAFSLTRAEAEALAHALQQRLRHLYRTGPLLTLKEREDERLLQALLGRLNGKLSVTEPIDETALIPTIIRTEE